MTAQRNFQWGISTLGCHELDLPSICKLAENHGIHHLEIRSLADCLDLPAYLDKQYPDNHAEAQRILDQHRQSIIALNSGFSLISGDDEARKELLAFARWADLLNVPLIRVFGGGSMSEPLTPADMETATNNVKWWNAQKEEHQWKTEIALETHGGFSSSARCLKLQETLNSPLNIIWDTHHTWKLANESAIETWEQLGPMIKHIHIKDSIPVPSARHDYSYVLPGAGEFPVADVFNLLLDSNFDGIVSLEWERKWHPYMPDLDTALIALEESGWKSGTPKMAQNAETNS